MAWIESHQEVGRHPKTKKLARRLGVSLPAAVGYLHYLWWWALDFAQDGILDKYDNDDIADALLWDGDPDQLIEALIHSGYIDTDGDVLTIHDWHDYAGKLLERRVKDRERKAAAKEKAAVPSEIQWKSNGTDTESAGSRTASSVTVPNLTVPNNTVPNSTVITPHTPQGATEPDAQERRFAEFWKAYPKKVGKKAAETAWKRVKPNAELFNRIMQAVTATKSSEQWIREGGRFIPNPATWINQGRWDDELPSAGTAPPFQRPNNGDGKPNTLSVLARIIAEEEGGGTS